MAKSGILVQLASPQLRRHSRLFAETVRCLLQALVMVNRITLRSDSTIPKLYRSGVVYQKEPKGEETFRDITVVRSLGHGDCAHLAAWRVAELQNAGENASLRIKWVDTKNLSPADRMKFPKRLRGGRNRGMRLFHVQVRRGDGTVEDPSRLLGMGKDQEG